MRYELYYWPSNQGRGEFVRLALEEAAADYIDVGRLPEADGYGVPAIIKLLNAPELKTPPFAPPFLKAGDVIIGHTANILMYLGAHHGLAPAEEEGRLWAHQLQLSVTDFAKEIHDTHHPVGAAFYYEEQKAEAKHYTENFLKLRVPKFTTYFETVLARNGGRHMVGTALSYVDLSMFQLVAGLRYAFPRAMARLEPNLPRLVALYDAVAARPRIAAYLASPRRMPFDEKGVFRHYPELDN
ncbi:MAG TPA: glutathione S-transferase family protein [Xanthobacteraceae bacterium]|jgi:glutathione S-transferase|nr:glutathione S-transferase family protein [Xanthobacteraceae bacterium]